MRTGAAGPHEYQRLISYAIGESSVNSEKDPAGGRNPAGTCDGFGTPLWSAHLALGTIPRSDAKRASRPTHVSDTTPLEYRDMSAAGTVAETLARLMRGANITRSLATPRTTGMPRRPTSSDGQPSVFVSSNRIGQALTLAEGGPSLRWPQPRCRRLRFGCRSYRLSPPKDGSTESRRHEFPLSRHRKPCDPARPLLPRQTRNGLAPWGDGTMGL